MNLRAVALAVVALSGVGCTDFARARNEAEAARAAQAQAEMQKALAEAERAKAQAALRIARVDAAPADPPRAAQPPSPAKWEYATLMCERDTNGVYIWNWQAGKAKYSYSGRDTVVQNLYEFLGGKDKIASDDYGIVLDQIGRSGWELVSHNLTFQPRELKSQIFFENTKVEVWAFKRPVVDK